MCVTCPFMKHHKSSFLENQESKKGPQQLLVKPQVRLLWADLRNHCFVPLSLSRALFASPAFPQSLSFTYQLLDCTGKEPPYLQLQLQRATSSLQRCPLWLPGLQRSERCFKFAQIHYYCFFLPQSVWQEAACQDHMVWKGDRVGLLSLGSTERAQSSNSDKKGGLSESSLTHWVCLWKSIVTLPTGNITLGRVWATQCSAIWHQVHLYEDVDIGRGDTCWPGTETAIAG